MKFLKFVFVFLRANEILTPKKLLKKKKKFEAQLKT